MGIQGPRVPRTPQQYETLLAVSEAIIGHRDLGALFHELASRLHSVAHFDFLGLVLLDSKSNTSRVYVLETSGFWPEQWLSAFPLEETPNGVVLETQEPLIVSERNQFSRWPRFEQRMEPFGMSSLCYLPLTTARRRIGVLALGCKQPRAYDDADIVFLRHVANQVAVAVENALAFQEIEALKNKLQQEKVYLEEEACTERNFGAIIGNSRALRHALKQVQARARRRGQITEEIQDGHDPSDVGTKAVHHCPRSL